MTVPSPLNWCAALLNRRTKETQLFLVEAYICFYVSVFMTTIAIGGGISIKNILF